MILIIILFLIIIIIISLITYFLIQKTASPFILTSSSLPLNIIYTTSSTPLNTTSTQFNTTTSTPLNTLTSLNTSPSTLLNTSPSPSIPSILLSLSIITPSSLSTSSNTTLIQNNMSYLWNKYIIENWDNNSNEFKKLYKLYFDSLLIDIKKSPNYKNTDISIFTLQTCELLLLLLISLLSIALEDEKTKIYDIIFYVNNEIKTRYLSSDSISTLFISSKLNTLSILNSFSYFEKIYFKNYKNNSNEYNSLYKLYSLYINYAFYDSLFDNSDILLLSLKSCQILLSLLISLIPFVLIEEKNKLYDYIIYVNNEIIKHIIKISNIPSNI